MKKVLVLGPLAAFFFALAVAGCKKESSEPTNCDGIDASANTYNNAIATILTTNCAVSGCHDAVTVQNGLNFTTYATSKSAFQTADVLCAINHDAGCEPMPQNAAKLSDATIQKIECWVENGYRE